MHGDAKLCAFNGFFRSSTVHNVYYMAMAIRRAALHISSVAMLIPLSLVH